MIPRILLVLALAAGACAGRNDGSASRSESARGSPGPDLAAPDSLPGIRGTITHVGADGGVRTVRIEEDPEAESGSPKASVRVTDSTRIRRQTSGGLADAAWEDLSVGMHASAWFEGPATLSYPMQVTGSQIVIEDQE